MMYLGNQAVGINNHDDSIININNEKNSIITLTSNLSTNTTGELSRLFSGNNAKVLYISGFTKINTSYMFQFMPSLKAAIFTDATSIGNYVFWDPQRTGSIGIDFYKTMTFSSATPFYLTGVDLDIILRSSEMSTTSFTTSTWGMPPKMKVYVPNSLVNTYLADNNWSTFGSERILPIEGTKYEDINWWKSIV